MLMLLLEFNPIAFLFLLLTHLRSLHFTAGDMVRGHLSGSTWSQHSRRACTTWVSPLLPSGQEFKLRAVQNHTFAFYFFGEMHGVWELYEHLNTVNP